MGYNIYNMGTEFHLTKAKQGVALRAALKLSGIAEYGGIDWKTSSIEAAFLQNGFIAEIDEGEDIVGLEFEDDMRYTDQREFMEAISPYIEKGSYISIRGEDDEYWRWYFTGKKMVTLGGYVEFEKPPEEELDDREIG